MPEEQDMTVTELVRREIAPALRDAVHKRLVDGYNSPLNAVVDLVVADNRRRVH